MSDATASETKKAKSPAAPAEFTKPAPGEERFVAASEARFATSAEFTFPLTSYIPEAGTPLEHVLRPEYWANVKQLKTGCRIWVQSEDDTYWAELLVRKVGQGFAKVDLLRSGELSRPTADPAIASEFDIEYRGPVVKHRVVRKKDGHVLKQTLETYEDACAWLRDYRRAMAA